VEDFDDLLPGSDTPQHLLAQSFVFDPSNELLGDSEVNVSLEQGHANFAESVGYVLFADAAVPTEIFEDLLKFVRKTGKHTSSDQREGFRSENGTGFGPC
jgi:hypothetical protein